MHRGLDGVEWSILGLVSSLNMQITREYQFWAQLVFAEEGVRVSGGFEYR